MLNDLTIYTAIYGNYDKLIDDQSQAGKVKYVCFTDSPNLKSNTWEVVHIPSAGMCKNRSAKRFKMMPHLYIDSPISLWIDGRIQLIKNPEELIDLFLKDTDMAVPEPPSWKKIRCLYYEAKLCIEWEKDNRNTIKAQIQKYRKNNYPENSGLWRCGVLLRKHFSKQIKDFNEAWWEEVNNYSKRDQISFPYILNKKHVKITTIGDPIYKTFFKKHNHRKVHA